MFGSRKKRQCRAFPWWKDNLESRKQWEEAAKRCEGIDHPDAPLIPLSDILASLKKDD
jgi:hypothetical protein